MDKITRKYKMLPNRIERIIMYKKDHDQYMNMKEKALGFKRNIRQHGLISHYNIRSDPFCVLVMLLLYL